MPTQDELWARLDDQRAILRTHIRNMDEGDWVQALVAAVTVRVLVHDTSKSRSLLSQLGVKTTMRWWGYPTLRTTSTIGLTMVRMKFSDGVELIPYRDFQRLVPHHFDAWWEGVPVRGAGGQGSRREIVLALANNDGGGHVDLDKDLLAAVRASAPQMVSVSEDGEETVHDVSRYVLFTVMRSILTEVDYSLTHLLEPNDDTPGSSALGTSVVQLDDGAQPLG